MARNTCKYACVVVARCYFFECVGYIGCVVCDHYCSAANSRVGIVLVKVHRLGDRYSIWPRLIGNVGFDNVLRGSVVEVHLDHLLARCKRKKEYEAGDRKICRWFHVA